MKVERVSILNETRFLNFNQADYVDTTGKLREWVYVSRVNNTRAVVIMAIVDNNKVVIIKEYRVPLQDYEYGFPAGLIDEGESVEETIKRELKEETGLDLVKIRDVSPFIYNSAGLTNESVAVAVVDATGTPSEKFLESSEDIETFLMNYKELKSLIQKAKAGEVKLGAKAYIMIKQFVDEKEKHLCNCARCTSVDDYYEEE